MNTLIAKYENGNYFVHLYKDGTKIRYNSLNNLIPKFPESIDLKITNFCDNNCPMCYERSSLEGKEADILHAKFIDTLHPYTEIAIGGGNPLSHPDLFPFLSILKEKNIIANMTVNQKHFSYYYNYLNFLLKDEYIHGLGVSYSNYSPDIINKIQNMPNVVIHTILGVTTLEDYENLKDKNLKILILGYKDVGKGLEYYEKNMNKIKENIQSFKSEYSSLGKHFKLLSFDNLAIKQLSLQDSFSKEKWDNLFMGEDGQYTFYIDLVNRQYAKNSISTQRFPLLDNADEMFANLS